MFSARRILSFALCLCVLLSALVLPALASSEPSEPSETPEPSQLSPVERVFQVISLTILFGGIALLPVYFLLNKRRKRIVASFGEKDDPTDDPKDDPGEDS